MRYFRKFRDDTGLIEEIPREVWRERAASVVYNVDIAEQAGEFQTLGADYYTEDETS